MKAPPALRNVSYIQMERTVHIATHKRNVSPLSISERKPKCSRREQGDNANVNWIKRRHALMLMEAPYEGLRGDKSKKYHSQPKVSFCQIYVH